MGILRNVFEANIQSGKTFGNLIVVTCEAPFFYLYAGFQSMLSPGRTFWCSMAGGELVARQKSVDTYPDLLTRRLARTNTARPPSPRPPPAR